jgi:uncharacterized protein YjdB
MSWSKNWGRLWGGAPSSIPVTGITYSAPTWILVGGTGQITASVEPANATDPVILYTSLQVGIATVNSSGLVTGVSAGTATIRLQSQSDPAVTVDVPITVLTDPPVQTGSIFPKCRCTISIGV